MNKTKIEWALNPDGTPGFTWNPITGCLNGCEYCYARKLANGRLKKRYQANENVAPVFSEEREVYSIANKMIGLDPFYPRFSEDKMLDVPIKNYEPNKHLGIFACSMSDLFGIGVPEEWTRRVLTKIRTGGAWHRFYLLTKQPQNLLKFSPFPDNAWVGVSATNQEQWDKALYYLGYHIEAKVKYISVEPFLNPITTSQSLLFNFDKNENMINQIIIGAQSKPTIMPKIEWVEEIVEAANRAGIPVFLKDSLKPLIERSSYSSIYYSDQGMTLRQGMPQ